MARNFAPKQKIGPRRSAASLAKIDKRTRPGRVYRETIAELVGHVGGAPTAAERILIEAAAVKSVRLWLLSQRLLDGKEVASDQNALAWLNSLRLDLQALGLASRAKDITPTLDDIKAEHAAKREAAE